MRKNKRKEVRQKDEKETEWKKDRVVREIEWRKDKIARKTE